MIFSLLGISSSKAFVLNLVISPSSSLFVYISGSSFKVLRLRKVKTRVFEVLDVYHLPVDSARTLIWFDIHLVVVDVNLRDVHLKVIGQELDWFPHCANARPSRCLEHLLQRGQVCACSYNTKRLVRVKSGHLLTLLSEKAQGSLEQEQESARVPAYPSQLRVSMGSDIPG